MIADPRDPADALIAAPTGRGRAQALRGSWLAILTSVPVLGIGLIVMIVIAAGPMQELDFLLARRWLYHYDPDLMWFAQNILDRVASQVVCLPILLVVAVVLARRRRSWQPVLFALWAEAAFLIGIGGMKVLFARGVTYDRDPSFFDAGLLEAGTKGISFPSGHASEAVLLYGAAVYLISHYSSASRRTVWMLTLGVALIAVNSAVVSFVLGWHWASDLLGGFIAGGFFLRLVIALARWFRLRHERARLAGNASPTL